MDPPFRFVETAFTTYLVIPVGTRRASSELAVHAMAAISSVAVVDVVVVTAASVDVRDAILLH